ncbi:MAG: pfkA [Clostridia bacterium]|jgi:6-phosphofructokinase 1|nr:pfkA [Clostridia bacterium]
MSNKVGTIGVLTSGGDAPGMNAAIRAVVRVGLARGIKVMGIQKGYNGLLTGDVRELTARSVSDTVQRGGTILQTARCLEFLKPEGQQRGAEMCRVFGIDGLVVIGGDGSFQGAEKLANLGINTIGVPGTIDLDIACTEYTIGFDTAVNTAMEAINKIRDTSTSHERCSIVEVMGRNAGYIALWCGISSGAELVLIPEKGRPSDEEIIKTILQNKHIGKKNFIIIVAEGIGGSEKLAKKIQEITGIESRATILGHLQRGGSPSAVDRIHASMMGAKAVDLLCEGKAKRVVAYVGGQYVDYDINEALAMTKNIDEYMYEVSNLLV